MMAVQQEIHRSYILLKVTCYLIAKSCALLFRASSYARAAQVLLSQSIVMAVIL